MLLCLVAAPAFAREDGIDRYATKFIAENRIPGLSLAVVRDGKVLKAAGYGYANLEWKSPAAADTVYEIGSITKTFTAQALMMLVEERKLALDDTLGDRLDGAPVAWRALTLRQLLTHTAGLKDWEGPRLLDFHREWTPAEYMELMGKYPLDFAPGTKWAYSNTSYPLLGLVIARASGKPFDVFMGERVFTPLGMSDTRMARPLEIVARRASGYVDDNGTLRRGEPLRPRIVEPNGAILSTVLDLAKWQQLLLGSTLLSRESLETTWTKVKLADGSDFPSGLGVFVDAANGHRLLANNGSTPGGFSSVFYHYPEDKLSVFVLCNVDRGDAVNRIATHVAGVYEPALAKAESSASASRSPRPVASRSNAARNR